MNLKIPIWSLTFLILIHQTVAQINSDEDFFFIVMDRSNDNYDNATVVAYAEAEDLLTSEIDFKNKPITFVIHGYTEGRDSNHQKRLTKTLLEKEDQIVIFVDWSKGSQHVFYGVAQQNVFKVAETAAKFITFLHKELGIDYDNVTLIGFSLGGEFE